MMRMIGAFFVVAPCTAYGFLKGALLSARVNQLRMIETIFTTLSGDIQFGQISLIESFDRIANQVSMPFSRLLKNISGEMKLCRGKTFDMIFTQEVYEVLQDSALDEVDKEKLVAMGMHLGQSNRDTQVRLIQLYLKELSETIAKIEKSIGNQQKIYRMLGVVSGILIVIILL